MQLVTARRAVRADLIVERHDLIAVIRTENGNVTRIGLRHEVLDRANPQLAGFVRLERVPSLQHLEPAVDDDRAPDGTLEMHRGSVARCQQSDTRMLEQAE